MQKSKIIEDFLSLIADCESKYPWAMEQIEIQNKLTQDLLHKIELSTYKDRIKTCTMLHKNRKDRRYYKDLIEEYEILINWIDENEKSINTLKQVLGKLRKIESYHADRTYYPRILDNYDSK